MRRMAWEASRRFGGWEITARLAPGFWTLGAYWHTRPVAATVRLPFLHIGIARADPACATDAGDWGWSLFRVTAWKTEFRLDIDLDDWAVGLECTKIDDFSVHLGPLNVQIETGKFYDLAFPPGVPVLRLFFPGGQTVQPWPLRCHPPLRRPEP